MFKRFFLFLVFSGIGLISAVEVKVLLADDLSQGWSISADRGVILRNNETKRVYPTRVTCHTFEITADKNGGFLVNNKKMKGTKLSIEAAHNGFLSYNGNEYEGSFLLLYDDKKNKTYLINSIDLEAYVVSVVKSESWPGWPLEVHKAMATSCRSYVLRQLLDARERALPYYIKSTNHHQTYRGVHTDAIIKQAVKETQGIFIAHKEYPILAMFDSCCGGIIPAHIAEGVDFSKAPYLARSYPCTYCKKFKIFSWKGSCSLDAFTKALQDTRSSIIHPVKEVRIVQKDKAGLVNKVAVKTKKGNHHLKARDIYRLLKEVKSLCFSIVKRNRILYFEGKGFGHHFGMCQWGARQMVDEGFTYRSILSFYYPGTTFMKVINEGVGEVHARV